MEELLKQILSEIKGLKEGQARIEQRLDSMDGRIDTLNDTVTRIERRHGGILSALADERGVQQDVNDMILEKLNTISMKVDKQEIMLLKHDRDIERLKKIINIYNT